MPLARPPYRLALALSLLAPLAACQSSDGDVREWKASDHEQPEHAPPERQPRRGGQVPAQAESAESAAMLTELAWQKNCQTCHGAEGKGDGPTGPLVRAPDLTRAEWQAAATDEQIARVIREGRNKMPKFDLPPEVVGGLIKRIRARKGR